MAESASANSPLAELERRDLAGVLRQLLAELKPPQGELLADFFLHGLGGNDAVGVVGFRVALTSDSASRLSPYRFRVHSG